MLDEFLNPTLLPETQAAIRVAYGVLLTATLAFFFSQGRRFFLGRRWGGYAAAKRSVEVIQNPVVMPAVAAVWLSAAVCLALGAWTVPAAAVNAALCWYFFVAMRWSGLHRGFGAPGFMTWWLGVAVFLLEFTSQLAPAVRSLAILAVQVDFALIMFSAGVYKAIAGYRQNEGMNYGLANPAWGYWWRSYARMPADHLWLKVCNQLAWSLEIIAAICMLIPPLRFWGGLIILVSFVYTGTQIRLGTLCPILVVCCLFFFTPGSLGSEFLQVIVPTVWTNTVIINGSGNTVLTITAGMAIGGYLALLPFAHLGLFYNFLSRRSLPGWLQRPLTTYTNLLGIIIWRVFSADHTRFFVRIYGEAEGSRGQGLGTREKGQGGMAAGTRIDSGANLPHASGLRSQAYYLSQAFALPNASLVNDYSSFSWRFRHVVESITLTCIFTSRRYFASNPAEFEDRLLTYAKTLPRAEASRVVFQYVRIEKADNKLHYVPEAEYVVDASRGTIEEHVLRSGQTAPPPKSVVFEAASPGSYVGT